jgi:hypothetical protein
VTLELTEVLWRMRETKHASAIFLSLLFLLFFYLSVTCLFPRVQSKCPLRFLAKASGEYPHVIYLCVWTDCTTPNGGFSPIAQRCYWLHIVVVTVSSGGSEKVQEISADPKTICIDKMQYAKKYKRYRNRKSSYLSSSV